MSTQKWLSVTEITRRCGIDRNTVLNTVRRGAIVGEKVNGKWWIDPDSADAFWDRERRGSPRAASTPEYEESRAKKTAAEAELKRLQVELQEGRLIPSEDVEAAIGHATDSLRTRLQSFGRAHGRDPQQAAELQAAVDTILRDWHQALHDAYERTVQVNTGGGDG